MKAIYCLPLIAALITGCGSDSLTPEPETPEPAPVSGTVVLTEVMLDHFTMLGKVERNNGDSLQSVGITESEDVEVIDPNFGVIPDVDGDYEVQPPIECLNTPPIEILSIDTIAPDWALMQIRQPVRYLDCEYTQYNDRFYLKHLKKLYQFPTELMPSYSGYPNHLAKLLLVAPNSYYNDTEDPLIELVDSATGNKGVYQMALPTSDKPVKIKLVLPIQERLNGATHNFVHLRDNQLYYAYGDRVVKSDIDTGKILQRWDVPSSNTPFYFQNKWYVATTGDQIRELMSTNEGDGIIGDRLPLPGYGSNSSGVLGVIDDRFIIGDRCMIWDMENWVGVSPQYNEWEGGASYSSFDTALEDNTIFCIGGDGNRHVYLASAIKLGDVTPYHLVQLPYTAQIGNSLSLTAPYMSYKDLGGSVFEEALIKFNLITGEQTEELHFFEDDTVIELEPIN